LSQLRQKREDARRDNVARERRRRVAFRDAGI
jgi:hypothetical protein